jgi:hypothetical protein
MLSPDDLKNGMVFILQLQAADGAAVTWLETLRGDSAARWYDLYRRSDWDSVRAEAGDIFRHRASEAELQAVRKLRRRRVFIHTSAIGADDVAAATSSNGRSDSV